MNEKDNFIPDSTNKTSDVTPKTKQRRKTKQKVAMKTPEAAMGNVIPFARPQKKEPTVRKKQTKKVVLAHREYSDYPAFEFLGFDIGLGKLGFILSLLCFLVGAWLPVVLFVISFIMGYSEQTVHHLEQFIHPEHFFIGGWVLSVLIGIVWHFNPKAENPPSWKAIVLSVFVTALIFAAFILGFLIYMFIILLIGSMIKSFK